MLDLEIQAHFPTIRGFGWAPSTDLAAWEDCVSLSITEATLRKFASHCDAKAIAPPLDAACVEYEINTARRLTHFMGQLYHESRGFTRLVEDLDYGAERLMQVWPKRFPTIGRAAAYAHNPPALANYVYGDRLGNSAPGDGWRYRGRGFIQITGKDNYRAASKWTGLALLQNPEQASTYGGASTIAAAFWADKGLNSVAEQQDEDVAIKAETRAINGSLLGLSERQAAIIRAQRIWS